MPEPHIDRVLPKDLENADGFRSFQEREKFDCAENEDRNIDRVAIHCQARLADADRCEREEFVIEEVAEHKRATKKDQEKHIAKDGWNFVRLFFDLLKSTGPGNNVPGYRREKRAPAIRIDGLDPDQIIADQSIDKRTYEIEKNESEKEHDSGTILGDADQKWKKEHEKNIEIDIPCKTHDVGFDSKEF